MHLISLLLIAVQKSAAIIENYTVAHDLRKPLRTPMSTPDLEKASHEKELRMQRQIAFASGLFQGVAKNQLQ
jgi:hypothetical protein